MRYALVTAISLLSLPAFAESHCAAAGADNQVMAAVSVPGDFRACLTRLMQGAKARCTPGGPELVLTVTGTENGKEADMRVLRVDCGGPKSHTPPQQPPAKSEAPPAKAKPDAAPAKK